MLYNFWYLLQFLSLLGKLTLTLPVEALASFKVKVNIYFYQKAIPSSPRQHCSLLSPSLNCSIDLFYLGLPPIGSFLFKCMITRIECTGEYNVQS